MMQYRHDTGLPQQLSATLPIISTKEILEARQHETHEKLGVYSACNSLNLLYTCNEIHLIQLIFRLENHATRVIFFRITILHVLPNSQDKSLHLAANSLSDSQS